MGGWIATRSGGHYATLYTRIDDFVESLRVVTPRGVVEKRRLPASGAGPAPDRLFIGSEGALGVITDAWMRLQRRPAFRAAASVHFPTFLAGAEAVRVIAQAGLFPANLRLLEPLEGAIAGAGDGSRAFLVLAFESADHPVEAALARGLEICANYGATFDREAEAGPKGGAAAVWRNSFIRMPYFKEFQVAIGILSATFETAITWDRFGAFYAKIKTATEAAIVAATGKPGVVTCRFTHVYPDGPAPYFTWHAMGHKAALLEQAQAIAAAAADAVETLGGTVTHHHAVGRSHMPWYVKERPALFGAALAAAKAELDPAGFLNPGVLLPARP